ncbi:DUF4169 family protein [Aurantiacibacter odishensis]|uniref:DUF4169 family protein n=1 Tax=Aurantiacibacter odishensis TaxID=1155476 RepID=UPI001F0BA8A0|nr:DUF4169 family protein [Aurantiacibacter odishensis]
MINLRMARKRRDRAAREKDAASARAQHGLGKAELASRKAEEARASRQLDGAKLERDD